MTSVTSGSGVSPSFLRSHGEISHEAVFEVLSNERRRRLVQYLDPDAERVPVSDIADALAAAEAATTSADQDRSVNRIRSSVYSSLVQTHLPMMADAGIVEYDDTSQEIRVTNRTREVKLYLEYSPGHDIPWAEFYLGLAAVGAALVVVSWLGVPPFELLDGYVVAGGVVAILFLSAVVHVAETRRNRLGDANE